MTSRAAGKEMKSDSVGAYKRVLADVLDRRPSGTRQRLAAALGKNRSFVTQITNPAYPVPVPVQHLSVIFDKLGLSTRLELALYALNHRMFEDDA